MSSRRLVAKSGGITLITNCALLSLDSRIGYPSEEGNTKAILLNQLCLRREMVF